MSEIEIISKNEKADNKKPSSRLSFFNFLKKNSERWSFYSNSTITLAMINAEQNVAQESTVKQTNLARIFKALKGALARSTMHNELPTVAK